MAMVNELKDNKKDEIMWEREREASVEQTNHSAATATSFTKDAFPLLTSKLHPVF